MQRLSANAGETIGELPRPTTADDVFRACIQRLGKDASENVVIASLDDAAFSCPSDGAVQVVLNLVQNARWAVRNGSGKVVLSSERTAKTVRLVVSDDGMGIDDDVLSRIGEPFVTTKAPGEGMGLGLFLARSFAQRWGGDFHIRSTKGKGTVATIELPHAAGVS